MTGQVDITTANHSPERDGRRRIRLENRERLMLAAGHMFAQRGYRGTTTRDIALAAGITERTLYRHVTTKAALFREAVIHPVEAFVLDFSSAWEHRPPGSRATEIEVREFYANLVAVIEQEQSLLLALLAALAYEREDEDFPELEGTLAPLLDRLTDMFAVEAELRQWTVDPAIGMRLVFAMAISATLHAGWLFSGRDRPTADKLVDQMTRLTVWGLAGAPAPNRSRKTSARPNS